MKKVSITISITITILVSLIAMFFLGRMYTLKTLEIIDDHSVQSMGQVHTYD